MKSRVGMWLDKHNLIVIERLPTSIIGGVTPCSHTGHRESTITKDGTLVILDDKGYPAGA